LEWIRSPLWQQEQQQRGDTNKRRFCVSPCIGTDKRTTAPAVLQMHVVHLQLISGVLLVVRIHEQLLDASQHTHH
jgi:hypothetical protein